MTALPARIGRYQILDLLGKGAMGTVYRGRDESLERDVAVKVISLGQADEDARMRFVREGKAAGRLQHPNIVTIYELGEHEGQPFMALELLEGMDLQRAIEAGMRPDPKFTLPIVLHLLAGLGHAHEHSIVHRDVKPSNLFLPRGRPAKIMDFGVARLAGGHTTTGMVIGTPNYMSPEQVRAGPIDGRSDLFSAGLILYELVTGEKTYNSDSVVSLLFKIVHEEPNFEAIPKGAAWERLRGVLHRSLAKDPGDRYADAQAMAADLEHALADLGGSFSATGGADQALLRGSTPRPTPAPTFVAAATAAPPAPPASSREMAPPGAGAPTMTPGSRNPLLLGAGLGALGVMAVATAGYFFVGGSRAPQPETPPRSSVTLPRPEPTVSATATAAPMGKPEPARPALATAPPPPAPSLAPLSPGTASPPVARSTEAEPAAATPAEARFDRANEHMEKGRYAQALAEAKAVLAKDPHNADAKALAGDAEAAIVIEECVKRARVALKAGDRETALAEAKKGLAVNPSEARLLGVFREATQ
jgi:eukaryotic-like serine/threonine-protein kinase